MPWSTAVSSINSDAITVYKPNKPTLIGQARWTGRTVDWQCDRVPPTFDVGGPAQRG